ncbi:hypothetical protein GGI35DRAFT_206997 [Trichoderma velutinum]
MLVPWCFSAVHLVSCQLSTTQNTEHNVLFLFSRTRDPHAKHNSTLHAMDCRNKSQSCTPKSEHRFASSSGFCHFPSHPQLNYMQRPHTKVSLTLLLFTNYRCQSYGAPPRIPPLILTFGLIFTTAQEAPSD